MCEESGILKIEYDNYCEIRAEIGLEPIYGILTYRSVMNDILYVMKEIVTPREYLRVIL